MPEKQDAESVALGIRADRLASEMVKRVKYQLALGRPSFYNIAREVLIEEFAAEQFDGKGSDNG